MFAARAMSKVAAPARVTASRATVAAPKRGMAGGAAPKYEGWEAKVREKLPKDEHVSLDATASRFGVCIPRNIQQGKAMGGQVLRRYLVASIPRACIRTVGTAASLIVISTGTKWFGSGNVTITSSIRGFRVS